MIVSVIGDHGALVGSPIVGIDPGFRASGVAVFEDGGLRTHEVSTDLRVMGTLANQIRQSLLICREWEDLLPDVPFRLVLEVPHVTWTNAAALPLSVQIMQFMERVRGRACVFLVSNRVGTFFLRQRSASKEGLRRLMYPMFFRNRRVSYHELDAVAFCTYVFFDEVAGWFPGAAALRRPVVDFEYWSL